MLHRPGLSHRAPRSSTARRRASCVIVVGAGPVGLAAAIDLAQRGQPVLVLDDDDTVSVGSRAICYAKRTLEILDRLGCGEPIATQGRELERRQGLPGRRSSPISSTCCPKPGHRRPAFVNLQQYHFEACLVAARARRCRASSCAGGTRSSACAQSDECVTRDASTRRTASTTSTCDWLDRRATARAARFATCSASTSRARCSATAS